ncbi:MAG: AEC family transporter [Kiritimatiellia bacterium]
MANLALVATQVGILFALMAVGAFCRRLRLVEETAIRGIVNVLVLIVTPALIIHCFQRPFDASKLAALALAFGIAFAAHLVLIAASGWLVRHHAADTQCVLRLAVVFSNAGFMGIPLENALFGADGVFYGIVYVVVFNIMIWSWGFCTMKGVDLRHLGRGQLRTVCLNPGTVGILLGLPLFLCSVRLPEVVAKPIAFLADLNTPLAMLVVGYYLAGAKLGPVLRSGTAYGVAMMRLLGFPLLLLAVLYPYRAHVERTMALALITAAAAPVAAMVSMFASQFNRDIDMSVGLVSGTTLLSILTMPLVIALAMGVL